MSLHRFTKSETGKFFAVAKTLKHMSPRLNNMMNRWKALAILKQTEPHVHMKTPNLSLKITNIVNSFES